MTKNNKTSPTLSPNSSKPSIISDHWIDSLLFFLLAFVLPLRLFIWRYYFFKHPISKVFMSNMDVAAVIFLLGIIFFLFRKGRQATVEPWLYGLGAYGGFAFISIFYSQHHSTSFIWWTWLVSLVLYLYMLVSMLNTPFRRYFFLGFWVCVAVVSAGWAIKDYIYLINHSDEMLGSSKAVRYSESLKYVLSRKRVASLMGWPNVQAAFFTLILPLTTSLVFLVKQKWCKGLLILATGMMLLAMLFTFSIGVWGTLAIGAMVVFLFSNRWFQRYRMLIWVTVGVLALVAAVIFFQRLGSEHINIGPRLGYIRSAWLMMAEYPFWGSGWATFQLASRPFILNPEHYSSYTHNSYLQILCEAGWLAFLGWMAFLYCVGRKIVVNLYNSNEHRWFYAAAAVSFVAYLIHNLMSFTMLAHNIAIFGWALFALVLSWPNHDGSTNIKKKSSWWVDIVLAVLCIGLVYASVRLHFAEHAFAKGLLLKSRNAGDSLASFEKASKLNPYDGRIDTALSVIYLEAAVRQRNAQLLNLSEKYALKARDKMPVVFEPYSLLTQVYIHRGDRKKAKEYRMKTIERAPYRALHFDYYIR